MARTKRKDDPSRFREKREFENFARRNGAKVKEGGNHTKIIKKGKSMTLSRGGKKGKKPNPGLLKAYLKGFKRIGLITSLFFIAYIFILNFC